METLVEQWLHQRGNGRFGGGPVGLSTLAVAVGEEADTVETVAEPYLVREGLLGRTPRAAARSEQS